MAVVAQELVIHVGQDALFDVIVDYARYPEFVPGIKACQVRTVRGEKQVEYELDLGLRRVRYVLRHEEVRPSKVTWSLVSGDTMKVSSGSWELEPHGAGRTRARYAVDVQLAKIPLVPQALIDRMTDEMTRVQLPKTLEAFRKRAEGK
jgi:ribosome-associated toxin RatA of RatAB toxin-antitoxin module